MDNPLDLLSSAIDQMDAGDTSAWKTMEEASGIAVEMGLYDHRFANLYGAVATHLAWLRDRERQETTGLHARFEEGLSNLLPGAKLVKIPHQLKHRPDFFISIDGSKPIPVEIKRHVFDAKAVRQLARYMKAYQADRGIAVAPKLSATLDDGMQFVQMR